MHSDSALVLRPVTAARTATRPSQDGEASEVTAAPPPRAPLSDEALDELLDKKRAPARAFLEERPGRLVTAAQLARALGVREAQADEMLMDCMNEGEADAFVHGNDWRYAAPGTVMVKGAPAPAPAWLCEKIVSYLEWRRPYYFGVAQLADILEAPPAAVKKAVHELLADEVLDMKTEAGEPSYCARIEAERTDWPASARQRCSPEVMRGLRADIERAALGARYAMKGISRRSYVRDFALKVVGSKLPNFEEYLGKRGTLEKLLQVVDPSAVALAKYSHSEGQRRKLIEDEYLLEEWMIDAIFERAYWFMHGLTGFSNEPRWRKDGTTEWHSDGIGEGTVSGRGFHLDP